MAKSTWPPGHRDGAKGLLVALACLSLVIIWAKWWVHPWAPLLSDLECSFSPCCLLILMTNAHSNSGALILVQWMHVKATRRARIPHCRGLGDIVFRFNEIDSINLVCLFLWFSKSIWFYFPSVGVRDVCECGSCMCHGGRRTTLGSRSLLPPH